MQATLVIFWVVASLDRGDDVAQEQRHERQRGDRKDNVQRLHPPWDGDLARSFMRNLADRDAAVPRFYARGLGPRRPVT